MMKKNFKRWFAVMMIFIMSVSVIYPVINSDKSLVAKAQSIDAAMSYTLGSTQSGILTENGDDQYYYQFNLPTSGKIHLTGSAYMHYVYLYVYDENAESLWSSNPRWNSTSEVISIDEELFLASGNYYFCVRKDGSNTGNYNFKIEYTSSNESFKDINGGSNNQITKASSINANGTSYNGQISINDEKDFYKFELTQSGCLNFNSTFYNINYIYWKIYNQDGEEIISHNPSWNSTTQNIVVDEAIYLNAGTYYLSISRDGYRYGMYSFSLSFSSSNESFAETSGGSNNALSAASQIQFGTTYKGLIAVNDDKDFYAFALDSSQTIVINVSAEMEYIYIKLYDGKGNEIKSYNPYWNSVSKKITFSETVDLEKGNYYLAVTRDNSRYGNYTVNVSGVTQNNHTHQYERKLHEATYFSKGYNTYTCSICGHSYKGDYTNKKILSTPYLTGYILKRKAYVSWYSVSDASGYQIKYSTNKKFKKGSATKTITVKGRTKTKKVIKKLKKKKKYYFKIRAYKKWKKKTVYSKWSSKKWAKAK